MIHERFLSVLKGKRGYPHTATIYRFTQAEGMVIMDIIYANDRKTARLLGQKAIREHLRRAILLS